MLSSMAASTSSARSPDAAARRSSMAPSSSSGLSPDAPLFVPQAPGVRQPAAPEFPSPFLCQPPPPVFPIPFQGPPPPPVFPSALHGLPPPPAFPSAFQGLLLPPAFPSAFQGLPPPPCLPSTFRDLPPPQVPCVTVPAFCGFPHGPGVGTQAVFQRPPSPRPMAMRHGPAEPAGMNLTQQPQPPRASAVPQGGGDTPQRSARSWRAASGRWRPKPLLSPRMHRGARRAAATVAMSTAAGGNSGDGSPKGVSTNEPSPRSVLAAATGSPPDSPPVVLPPAFPYLPPTPTSPPASAGDAQTSEPPCQSVPPTESPLVPRVAPRRGSRRGVRRPRRCFNPASSLTTLMIRNIPNGFTREKMLNIVDQHCAEVNAEIALAGGGGVKSAFDFLYVPFDFQTTANKGYCFVNVTSPDAAFRLWRHLHSYRWKVNDSRKTCEVDYASIQGREALVAHFSGSYFECDTEKFLPVWFEPPRDGSRPAVVECHVVGHLAPRPS